MEPYIRQRAGTPAISGWIEACPGWIGVTQQWHCRSSRSGLSSRFRRGTRRLLWRARSRRPVALPPPLAPTPPPSPRSKSPRNRKNWRCHLLPSQHHSEPVPPTATPVPTTEPTAATEPTRCPNPRGAPTNRDARAPPAPSNSANTPVSTGQGCILYLHGAGTPPGNYDESWGGIKYLGPHSGNNEQPWFWLYDGPHNFQNDPGDTNQPYNQLVADLTATLDSNDCGPTMLYGASNGGGFAARIYCSGEDFGGRMWGVMVDDPVPDAGVIGCSPSSNVQRTPFRSQHAR